MGGRGALGWDIYHMPAEKKFSYQEHHHEDGGHIVRPSLDVSSFDRHAVDDVAITSLGFNLDDYAGLGFAFRGKVIADLDQVVEQIDSGRSQDTSDGVITYAFMDYNTTVGIINNPSFGQGKGYSPFSEAQRAEARESVELWDDLVAVEFVEVEPGPGKSSFGKNDADIWLANTVTGPAQAAAYYPGYGNQYERIAGDIWVASPELNWTNAWLDFNGYGATTLIHELGHSIGLSHPGAYNYDPDLDLTYDNYAEYAQDSEQYTIMSYWGAGETGAVVWNWDIRTSGNAQTPMLHDIVTIQEKYGADLTTRVGDTVYGFNSTAGNEVFDFSLNSFPNVSIYDAGGIDTIDLSGFEAGVQIDLHDGSFSSGAQAIPDLETINANRDALSEQVGISIVHTTQASLDRDKASLLPYIQDGIEGDTGVAGVEATAYMNLSIAYGTVIENAIGTDMRDVLWGNEVANVLQGNGGDDVLNGFEGADTLIGGDGADMFQFWDMDGVDTIADFESGVDMIDVSELGFTSFSDTGVFSNTAGELIYADGMIQGDLDGDGEADFQIDVQGDPVTMDDLLL